MVSCFVPTCDNTFELNPDLSFHRFPTKRNECILWLKALNLTGVKPRVSERICIQHFNRDDLRICTERIRLVVGAIPTLNPKEIYESSPLPKNGKSLSKLIKKENKNRREPSNATPVKLRRIQGRRQKVNKTSKIDKKSLKTEKTLNEQKK